MKHIAKKIIRNTVVLLFVGIGLIWVCSKFIHLGMVEYTDNAQVRRYIVPVNCRVQGYVKDVNFNDYQEIKKGDTLVLIEDSEYQLRVAQAKADYQRALLESTVIGAAISTTKSNMDVSDAVIEESKIRMEQAESDYKRYAQLFTQKAVTQQQYEAMKADYDAKRAKYEMQVRQKRSTSKLKEEQTHRQNQNQSNIDVAKAALELAQLNLSYTVIVAPCDGVVSRKSIQEGQFVQPGQTLLSVVDNQQVWVIANTKETRIANIEEGMRVKIEVDAVPEIVFYGTVGNISKATGAQYSVIPQDNSAGNFVKVEQRITVKIEFTTDNKPEDLRLLTSGMNVECEVLYNQNDKAISR